MRLLRPASGRSSPREVDLDSYFSAAEIERGRAVRAAPARARRWPARRIELGALARLVRRPPRCAVAQRRSGRRSAARRRRPGCRSALSLPTLPLSRDLAPAARSRSGSSPSPGAAGRSTWLKAAAIEAVLAAGGGRAAVAVTRRYPRGWWLPAAGGSVGVRRACSAALAPVVLDPIFNDFTPLPEGETRSDVLALAAAAGVEVGEVYSVDASRRTTAANAYVTGLGPTKRVVLFDTLLDRYSRDEVRLVVAHELGPRAPPRRAARRAVRGARRAGGRARGPAAELGAVARARHAPARCPRSRWRRRSSAAPLAADRQPAVAGDRAPRRRVLARADRGAASVHLVRARDRAAERRRPRPAALAHRAAGDAPADRRADRRGGRVRRRDGCAGGSPRRCSSLGAPPPPNSGRFLIPSRVCHLE